MDRLLGLLTVLEQMETHSRLSTSTHHVPVSGNVLFTHPSYPPLLENQSVALSVLTDISFL